MRKYWYRKCLIITLVFSVFFYAGYSVKEKMERNEKEEVSAGTVSDNTVIPGGMPIGIYLETEGVMVLGTEKVTGTDGERLEPARHLVKAGDYIVECNGTKIRDKKELQTILKTTDGTDVILKLRRDSEYLEVKVKPVRSKKNNCMLGIWVRDNAQGLGTVTFLNSDSRFGALGHGIHDTDTNALMEIRNGRVYETSIRSIQKGIDGNPGGIEGIIVYNRYNVLGKIDKNTDCGIFGTLDRTENLFQDTDPMEIMQTDEIKKGDAKMFFKRTKDRHRKMRVPEFTNGVRRNGTSYSRNQRRRRGNYHSVHIHGVSLRSLPCRSIIETDRYAEEQH